MDIYILRVHVLTDPTAVRCLPWTEGPRKAEAK